MEKLDEIAVMIFDLDGVLIDERGMIYRDTVDVLEFLAKLNIKCHVVSYNLTLDFTLANYQLTKYFVSAVCDRSQPKSTLILQIMNQYQYGDPDKIRFYDDQMYNILDVICATGIKSYQIDRKCGITLSKIQQPIS